MIKAKDLWMTALALAAIALVSVVAYRRAARPPVGVCQVCQRALHHGMNFSLGLADGSTSVVCCPRCGLHYELNHTGAVRKAWATDFSSGQSIPAESAYYVEGGDVAYCTAHEASVRRVPDGVTARQYDRCLPTLVAFRALNDAEAYQTQHGGRILKYPQTVESVQRESTP